MVAIEGQKTLLCGYVGIRLLVEEICPVVLWPAAAGLSCGQNCFATCRFMVYQLQLPSNIADELSFPGNGQGLFKPTQFLFLTLKT